MSQATSSLQQETARPGSLATSVQRFYPRQGSLSVCLVSSAQALQMHASNARSIQLESRKEMVLQEAWLGLADECVPREHSSAQHSTGPGAYILISFTPPALDTVLARFPGLLPGDWWHHTCLHGPPGLERYWTTVWSTVSMYGTWMDRTPGAGAGAGAGGGPLQAAARACARKQEARTGKNLDLEQGA